MVRWISFDDETAEAVVSRFRRGAAEIHRGDPLSTAIGSDRPSLVLLPSSAPDRVLMAHIKPGPAVTVNDDSPMRSGVTGFRGLTDEPVFNEPQTAAPVPKKKWWRRRTA
jgi:hypothetical protein